MTTNKTRSAYVWLPLLLAAVASPAAAQQAAGLYGEYFNNNSLTAPSQGTVRNDDPTNKQFGTGAPPAPAGMAVDNFSIRWRGLINIPSAGTWTFYANPDDVARVWIDGVLIIHQTSANTERAGTITLSAGNHPIVMEMIEFGGGAKFEFRWQGPGGNPVKALVPLANLLSESTAPIVVPAAPTIDAGNGGTVPVNGVTMSTVTAGAQIYYTLDNTDPGIGGPKAGAILYAGPFNVSQHAVIRARAYNNPVDGCQSTETVSNLFSSPYAAVVPGSTQAGMYFRYFHTPASAATFVDQTADFDATIPNAPAQQRGLMTTVSNTFAGRDRGDYFALMHTGYLTVASSGIWTFFLSSDEGSQLFIQGQRVVENDGMHGTIEKSGQIYLNAGAHPFEIRYFERTGGEALTASWIGPGGVPAKQAIPAAAFSSTSIVATPTFTPAAPAGFVGSQVVTISTATPGATIYYTLDGSAPDNRVASGGGPSGLQVTLDATTTLRAVAFAPGMNPSVIAAGTFSRNAPALGTVLSSGINTEVLVTFDRPVAAATAGDPGNYTINNGVTVSAATVVPKTGTVVGQWSLNADPPVDSTGANANGTLTNATLDAVNFAPLVAGNTASLSFNGTTAYASIPDGPALEVEDKSFTVTTWIRPATVAGNKRIVNKWDNAANGGTGWYLDLEGTTFRFRIRDSAARDSNFTFGSTIAANVWSFVAARFDAERKQMQVFLNGVPIGTVGNANVSSDDTSTAVPLGIGAIPTLLGNYYSGNIDEIKLWRVALSNEEIWAMATGPDSFSGAVRLTTSALTAGTRYTLSVSNVADLFGFALPPGSTQDFQYFPTGSVRLEFYENLGNGNVADFTRNPIYPYQPTNAFVLSIFESDTNFDNFGGRTRGYFIAPSTNNFRFASSSDDAAQLWLSTNEDPANKILISRNLAWTNYRDYADPDVRQSVPIPLVAGRKYYLEHLFKEGTGGDHMSVTAMVDAGGSIPANQASIAGASLCPIQPLLSIVRQPVSAMALPGGSVTLSVVAQGTAPLSYQWRVNGTPIGGATGSSLTLTGVTIAESGNYTVVVTDATGSITSAVAIVGVIDSGAVPTITAVAPPHGRLAGGDTVVLTGTNLVPWFCTVTFGGAPATGVVFNSTTQITCLTPAHAAGPVDVVLTSPGGTSTLVNGFAYWDAPTLSAVSGGPTMGAFGPLSGGNSVTLTGTNFVAGYTSVTFGGTAATAVNVTATTTLTCTVPAHAAGVVDVVVTAPGGTGTLVGGYEYLNPPTFTSLAPATGPLAGGQAFSAGGTNLIPGYTSVSFGGNNATAVAVAGTRDSLTGTTPGGGATGTVAVTISTPGGTTAAIAGGYTYYGIPTLTAVTPADGPEAGGQSVVLDGTNFVAGLTSVTFGGVGASITAISATQITVSTPAGTGLVAVAVTTPGGVATMAGGYRYHPIPTAATIDITAGPTIGGTLVTIGGTGFFSGLTTVTFGGTLGTGVVVTGTTSLTVSSPSHLPGSFDVVVTTPGGSATLPLQFTYSGPFISSIVPDAGPSTGGSAVTLTGVGFTGTTGVSFGGTAATAFTVVSPTQIDATVPAHVSGPVTVLVTTGAGNDDLPAGFTYFDPPTLASIVLNQGPSIGGQTVTLTGTNFAPGFTTVTLGGTAATGVSIGGGNTTLTCTTPAHLAGTFDVVVTTFGLQSATLASSYTFIDPPTISSVLPSRGPTTGGQTVTIGGTNFVPGQTAVSFGITPATGVVVALGGASLTCTSPAGAGTVAVTVTTFGLQTATVPGAYTYVDASTTVDLALTQTTSDPAPDLGDVVVLTLTLTNSGVQGGTGISVRELLPAGVDLLSATATQGTYSVGTGLWTVGSLAPAATVTLTLQVAVNTTTPVALTGEVFACSPADLDSTPNNGVAGEDDQATVNFSTSLQILTLALENGTTGAPYWQAIAVRGGAPAYTWSLSSGTLPFNLDPATGVISGTAPAAGVYAFTIAVTDSDGPPLTVTQAYTIIVSAPPGGAPTINDTPAPPDGTIGIAYDHTFTATDGQPPYTWGLNAGTLPTGLFLNGRTGRLAGTPSATGTFNFTLQAVSTPVGTGTRAFSITINHAPFGFKTLALGNGAVGQVYSQLIELEGGLGPVFTWSLASGALPPGLTLSPGTGRSKTLSGTPTINGSFPFTLQATDGGQGGLPATRAYTVVISSAGGLAFEITTLALPSGTLLRPYSIALSSRGGTGFPSWSLSSGTLPAGITLNPLTGLLSGTPTAAGRYELVVAATAGTSDTQALTLDIAPTPEIISDTPLPQGLQGEFYAFAFISSGGQEPLTWTPASALPAGLSLDLNSGVLSGTLGAAGGTFDVTVTDVNGAADTETFTLVVQPSAGLSLLASLPVGRVGTPYSATLTALGGTAPYTYSVLAGALPSWATLNAATGVISGTPDLAGSTGLTFQVADSVPATANSGPVTLVVDPVLTITPLSAPGATPGSPYTLALTATGAQGAVTWQVISGTLAPGLSLDSLTGVISGTPSSALGGFTVQATDATGNTAQRRYTFTGGGGAGAGGSGSTEGSGGSSCSMASSGSGGRLPPFVAGLALLLLSLRGRRARSARL